MYTLDRNTDVIVVGNNEGKLPVLPLTYSNH